MNIKLTHRPALKLISAAIGLILGTISSNAMASAFQLTELNGTNAGNYTAGIAAEAADASTSFFNPAGLVYIQHDQAVGSLNYIFAKADFTGTDTWNTFPANISPFFHPVTLGAENLKGGGVFPIPAFYYSHPFNENLAFGVSVNSPFGLDTSWGDTSAVRYANTKTKVTVYDLSPALGGKITDKLSIGAGIDFDYSRVVFNEVAGVPGLSPAVFPLPFAQDANAENNASAFGIGAHLGLIYQSSPGTRFGINYASQVRMHYTGDTLLGRQIFADHQEFTDDSLYSDVTMPATTTASFFHMMNPRWALLGTAMYTQWSAIKDIILYNVAGVNSDFDPQLIVIDSPVNFRDTWRLALGANYFVNQKLMVRLGGGYDTNPTNDVDRNLRLPDGNRIGLAIGAHYQAYPTVAVDVGYTHLFIEDGDINNTSITGGQQATVVGSTDNSGDIIGLQLTWNIT